ncbi:SMI1-KNR4 cell-wall [Flavobacterium sp. CF108]|uniref:SMI1/KNR4 family protein n=1 Tax=unclassified Flavobacterium TaxID=196869 RepID=UPI0008ABBE5D|nr:MULTISPECIES: SMI1/KNR4 family protein [unclassified Flavobacterium]SEO26956.1 SMI1-KNR4 cell-wall [Flavobacterium sp. fv08]SHG46016.1 SMI1-KNR4 cell-wall [Flavobacterium sp. CF108]
MKEDAIKTIIDYHLNKWDDIALNSLPIRIETEMADPTQDKKEEWRIWFPIDSRVNDFEIEEFENQLGHKLPNDYKTFLKHKHFYELQISEVSFCRHPVNIWKASLSEMIFEDYPTEFLIEKGYVPFARWSDWGLLCFDSNRNKENLNYPIVLWDHETEDQINDEYEDFYSFLTEIDIEDKKNIS